MKTTNLWIITLDDGRKFEIACKKQETAIIKIEQYYLNNNEELAPSYSKDIMETLKPNKRVISYKIDMRGILTI